MLVSNKIGALPVISAIFDHGPLTAGLVMIAADFLAIYFLMFLEGLAPDGVMPWKREQYMTFKWNDTIWIPLYLGLAVWCVGNAPPHYGFYTQTWWHLLLLVVGFITSIALEIGAVKGGQYSLSQEMSPSKLWHTFIFGIVFYWMLGILAPLLIVLYNDSNWIGWGILFLALGGFVINMYLDATRPFPENAHLEGTYAPWDWRPRKY